MSDFDPDALEREVSRRTFVGGLGRMSAAAIVPGVIASHHKRRHHKHHNRAHRDRRNDHDANPSSGAELELRSFGAHGDGISDDTAAIQEALDAATPGTTVVGDRGDMYVITDTLNFPSDGVTLDLRGAGIRIGAVRAAGSLLETNDTMLSISGRQGVRVTNGSMLGSASRYEGTALPYRIHIDGGSSCQLDRLNADCGGSMFAYASGTSHTIADNWIANGGIGGLGCRRVVASGNVILNSPYNALGFTGFRDAPCIENQYLNNRISGHGLMAIEEHSPDAPGYNARAVIRGNVIGPPSPNAASGTAISAVGISAIVDRNRIEDAAGYAIEVSGLQNQVLNNQISWQAAATGDTPAIVVNASPQRTPYSAVISRNTITNASVAIATVAQPWLAPLYVSHNTVVNPSSIGIDLCPPSGTIASVACHRNTLNFTSKPTTDPRIGIKTTGDARVASNRVSYTKDTFAMGFYDIPLQFVGNNVVLAGNLTDGGGRTDDHIFSSAPNGTWSGWSLADNSFIHGAPAKVTGLAHPRVRNNRGLS